MESKTKITFALAAFVFAAFSTFILVKLAFLSSSDLFNVADYYFEVDPVMLEFLRSPNIEFYNSFFPPQMTPLSVVLRAPFIFIFESLGIVTDAVDPVFKSKEFTDRYLAGAVVVVFFGLVAFLISIFQTGDRFWKKEKNKKYLKFFIFSFFASLLIALNPLIVSSMLWGHPEETLMACLLVSGGLFLLKKKYITGAVLIGLAVATKQPALFIVPAAFFFIPKEARVKASGAFILTVILGIVPWILTHPADFFDQNILVAGSQDFNVPRGFDLLSPLGLRDWGEIGKPLMFLIAFLLPFSLARLNQKKKSLRPSRLYINQLQFAGSVVIIFVFRFALDLGNISYYALPAGLSFVLLDFVWQNKKGGPWLEAIKNPPMTLPIFAFFGSVFFSIVFYQDLFQDMGVGWRGSFTLIVIGFPLLAGILSLYQPVSKGIGKKQWATAGVVFVLVGGLLYFYHDASNKPNLARQYKDLKEYRSNEKMLRAIPDKQTGYWLGENPDLGPGRELLFRGLDGGIVFNIYSPEGRRTIYFDYGKEGSKKSLEITTYNTELAERRAFIDQCLNKTGDCLGYKQYYNLPAGDALIYRYKQGFEGYVKTKTGQTVYIKNRDKSLNPKTVLELLRPLD